MGKENQRPPASRFLFIITPLFPHCTASAECLCLVCTGRPVPLSPSATWRIYDTFLHTLDGSQLTPMDKKSNNCCAIIVVIIYAY
jgi:hypothetical protein